MMARTMESSFLSQSPFPTQLLQEAALAAHQATSCIREHSLSVSMPDQAAANSRETPDSPAPGELTIPDAQISNDVEIGKSMKQGRQKRRGRVKQSSSFDGTDILSTSDYTLERVNGKQIFCCTKCPKTFSRMYNLRSHAKTHQDHRPFECEVCGTSFTR